MHTAAIRARDWAHRPSIPNARAHRTPAASGLAYFLFVPVAFRLLPIQIIACFCCFCICSAPAVAESPIHHAAPALVNSSARLICARGNTKRK